jgi:hypothetical protein
MKVRWLRYTLDRVEPGGIFLAGPTYRDGKFLDSWRATAVQHLIDINFNDNIYIPEFIDKKPDGWTYDKQVMWELEALNKATVIMFWIPREERYLPAFTTNIEFGEHLHTGKIVVGAPNHAEKMEYIRTRCRFNCIPVYDNLFQTVAMAKAMYEKKIN